MAIYRGSGLGRGALVELADGSAKYDMISGIGVHYLGHNHPLLVSAGLDAALHDVIQQGNLQQNINCLALMRTLVGCASAKGARLAHAFLTSSGAMANENALKIIFQKRHPADRAHAPQGDGVGRARIAPEVRLHGAEVQRVAGWLSIYSCTPRLGKLRLSPAQRASVSRRSTKGRASR